MAWTSPYEFTALELLTAAKMNAIQDNITWLHDAAIELTYIPIQLNTDIAITTGDNKARFHIPSRFNGWTISYASGSKRSGTGTVSLMLRNVTDAVDVFSSALSIASNNAVSTTVTINTANDDLATNDIFAWDVDGAGSSSLDVFALIGLLRP